MPRTGESLLRIRFSFVSARGYPAADEEIRSSGAAFFPVDSAGRARPANSGQVLLTEFPPGSSASRFDLYAEYGERPAIELGVAAAIVDLRGGVAASLRTLANPMSPDSAAYASEEQFALVMLREFDDCAGWNNGCLSCAHWLHWRTGIDLGAAREKVRVARALAALPRISEAMQRGAQDYLVKGRADRMDLVRSVRNAIEKAGLRKRIAERTVELEREVREREYAQDELRRAYDRLEELVLQRTADLEQAIRDLHAASRLKDEFLATLSHELRTPHNAVLGWSAVLRSGRVDDATVAPVPGL